MGVNLKPGANVGGYEIVREISRGGFATAFEAKDRHGQRVFFKHYKSPSPLVTWYKGFVDHQKELKKRVESDAALKDRCYRFVEFFTHGSSYCQVFEFVDSGMPLTDCIARKEEFPWETMVTFAKVMMFAIKYLHNVKIVHTDLKPDNVMLIPDAGVSIGYRLRLVDLDWSIFSDRKAPWDGEQGYIGTPGYQSPEHLKAAIPFEASDIFTCGIMLSEMLGGGHPFAADADNMDKNVLAQNFKPFKLAGKLPKVEDQAFVESVINACFLVDPLKRPTAAQIGDALSGKVFPWASEIPSAKPVPSVVLSGSGAKSGVSHAAKINLIVDGNKFTTIGVDTTIGKTNFRHLGAASDAKFLSDPQFEIKKQNGAWMISHHSSATNETIVNGSKLEGMMPVSDGMIVAVGNSSTGVEKFPITLQVA